MKMRISCKNINQEAGRSRIHLMFLIGSLLAGEKNKQRAEGRVDWKSIGAL